MTPTLRQLIEGATKGPWSLDRNMIFAAHMGGLIARTYDNCETGSDKNSVNNAQLIARMASPEVALAVLEALEGALDYGDFNANEEMPGRLRSALRLINGQAQPSPAPHD